MMTMTEGNEMISGSSPALDQEDTAETLSPPPMSESAGKKSTRPAGRRTAARGSKKKIKAKKGKKTARAKKPSTRTAKPKSSKKGTSKRSAGKRTKTSSGKRPKSAGGIKTTTRSGKSIHRAPKGKPGVMAAKGIYAMVVRMPRELHAKLWKVAEKRGVSFQSLAITALEKVAS